MTDVVARADGVGGELVLRRRGAVAELIVDGVFAMDSAHTATEEALATLALARLAPDAQGLRVVVGGLGLGYTTAAVLADPRVSTVDVVELEPALVGWIRGGLAGPAYQVPRRSSAPARAPAPACGVLADPRVRVHLGDVRAVIPAFGHGVADLVLLDVDNGPGFLVHGDNAGLYRPGFLAEAAATLRPGGVLAVWSADPAPELHRALETVCARCDEVLFDVEREGRAYVHALYIAPA